MSSFADCFWDKEIGSFYGFEVLQKRLADGKRICKDFLEFYRQRAAAQEAYGKALVKLARSAGGKDEIGMMRQSLEVVKLQTEVTGAAHIQAASQQQSEMMLISEFLENIREQRKKAEELLRPVQNNIRMLHKKMVEAKKASEMKCQEELYLSQQYQTEVEKAGSQSKEAEKACQKYSRARQSMEQVVTAYRAAIQCLEDGRQHWERETEKTYMLFQRLEETRLTFLRDSIWKMTNIGSSVCVSEDRSFEVIRQALEKCDANNDIQAFIKQKGTGSLRPSPVTCAHFLNCNSTHNSDQIRNSEIGLKDQLDLPQPLHTDEDDKMYMTLNFSAKEETCQKNVNETELYEENSLYVSHDFGWHLPGMETRTMEKMEVLYNYQSSGQGDISLSANDVVNLISKEHGDWFLVQTEDGEKGFFPATYLKPVEKVSGWKERHSVSSEKTIKHKM